MSGWRPGVITGLGHCCCIAIRASSFVASSDYSKVCRFLLPTEHDSGLVLALGALRLRDPPVNATPRCIACDGMLVTIRAPMTDVSVSPRWALVEGKID